LTSTLMLPFAGVNFRAFDRKFSRIYRYLLVSPAMFMKYPTLCSSNSYLSWIYFCWAWNSIVSSEF